MYNYNNLIFNSPFKRMGGNAEEDKNKVAPLSINITKLKKYPTELSVKDDNSDNDYNDDADDIEDTSFDSLSIVRSYPVIVSFYNHCFMVNAVDYPCSLMGPDLIFLLMLIRNSILRFANNEEHKEPTLPSKIRLYPNEFIMMINV